MNLYQINEQILNLVDIETGEITDFESLNELLMQKDEKIENVALFIKNLESDISELKAEIDSQTDRMNKKKKHAENLKKYLSDFMLSEGIKKVDKPKVAISFRKSSKVICDDEDQFIMYAKVNGLDDLYTEKTTQSIAKAEIKKYLKGNELPFIHIEESQNISIK